MTYIIAVHTLTNERSDIFHFGSLQSSILLTLGRACAYAMMYTQQAHNVETTSIQRWFNQRWIDVVSTLCACWDIKSLVFFFFFFFFFSFVIGEAYFNFSDCANTTTLSSRFPELFHGHTQEQPYNFTVTYYEKEALELGGWRHYFYPGITIELFPGSPSMYISLPHISTSNGMATLIRIDKDRIWKEQTIHFAASLIKIE